MEFRAILQNMQMFVLCLAVSAKILSFGVSRFQLDLVNFRISIVVLFEKKSNMYN